VEDVQDLLELAMPVIVVVGENGANELDVLHEVVFGQIGEFGGQ